LLPFKFCEKDSYPILILRSVFVQITKRQLSDKKGSNNIDDLIYTVDRKGSPRRTVKIFLATQ